MAINLADIRSAAATYLRNNVTVTIGVVIEAGAILNPNEIFAVDIRATNTGGVRIKNVRLRVEMVDSAVAKLQVKGDFLIMPGFPPPVIISNVKDLNGSAVILNQLVSGMIIDFGGTHGWNVIDPGENLPTVRIFGKAGSATSGGTTSLRARIVADVDQDYLFPPNTSSNFGLREVKVVG